MTEEILDDLIINLREEDGEFIAENIEGKTIKIERPYRFEEILEVRCEELRVYRKVGYDG